MIKQAAFAVVCAIRFLYGQGQTVTVTAVPGPDETISQKYVALDGECRRLVSERQHPAEAVTACKQVAEQADQFAPQSHFITRRGAFVYYTSALIQAKDYKAAVTIADKAVAVVLLGHDDASGSSAPRMEYEGRRELSLVI